MRYAHDSPVGGSSTAGLRGNAAQRCLRVCVVEDSVPSLCPHIHPSPALKCPGFLPLLVILVEIDGLPVMNGYTLCITR